MSIARPSRRAILRDIGASGRSNPDQTGTTGMGTVGLPITRPSPYQLLATPSVAHCDCPAQSIKATASTSFHPDTSWESRYNFSRCVLTLTFTGMCETPCAEPRGVGSTPDHTSTSLPCSVKTVILLSAPGQ